MVDWIDDREVAGRESVFAEPPGLSLLTLFKAAVAQTGKPNPPDIILCAIHSSLESGAYHPNPASVDILHDN